MGVATVLSAAALGAATTQILGGAATGIGAAPGQAAANLNPAQVYVDRLFRPDAAPPAQAPGANDNARARAEAARLWTSSLSGNGELAATDRTYIAQLIAPRTGMSQADAENA